jgi:hypothetical protein
VGQVEHLEVTAAPDKIGLNWACGSGRTLERVGQVEHLEVTAAPDRIGLSWARESGRSP